MKSFCKNEKLHFGRFSKSKLFQCVAYAFVITIAASCKHIASAPQPQGGTHKEPFRYLGRILNVEPKAGIGVLKVWRVEAEVISTSNSLPHSPPPIGSNVVFFVHSIVQTFRLDKDAVVGKTYLIEYEGDFKNPYEGTVNAK